MAFIGMILAILGMLVFPCLLIVGLVKPAQFAKWDKIPNTRKGIAKFFGIASVGRVEHWYKK